MTPETPLIEANQFFIVGHGFVDDQAVTYTAPQKIDIVPTFVDVQIVQDADGNNIVKRTVNDLDETLDGLVDTSVNTNIVFIGEHTFVDGDLIVYESTGPDITGLVSGTTYEVIFNTDVSIQLSAVRADPTMDPLVALEISGVDGGEHSIRRVGHLPIGGLNDGQTYYVKLDATQPNPDPDNRFTLAATPGGADIVLTTNVGGEDVTGDHMLSTKGVDITSAGSGNQRLIIDITSQGGVLGIHQFEGVGGPRGLLGTPPGDDIVSASSTGTGGGAIAVRDADSDATANPNVAATVNSNAKLVAGNIVIESSSASNSSAVSSNRGGGFVDVGSAEADALSNNTVTTTIQAAAKLTADQDVTVNAHSDEWSDVESATNGGGFLGFAKARARADLNHTTTVDLNGEITAGGAIVATSSGTGEGNNFAEAKTGGLGANVDANDTNSKGIFFNILTTTKVGASARLDADSVDLNAVVDGLDAKAKSNSKASALGADSDARARVEATSVALVNLLDDSFINGNRVELHSDHLNIDLETESDARCSCGGGDTDARANTIFNGDSQVKGGFGSTIQTSDLVVDVNSAGNLKADADKHAGLFDGGSESDSETDDFNRTIDWESTVILVGVEEPELRIDDTGAIVAKENLTVRERLINGTLSGPKAVGDAFTPGATIVVDDIVFTPGGKATFRANPQDENDDDVDVDATIIGTQGEFDFRESYETITILNASDREMEIGDIRVFNDGTALRTKPEITLDVENVGLGVFAFDFQFDVDHSFPPTVIKASNFNTDVLTDLRLTGDIQNPIGDTQIVVTNGNLFQVPGRSGVVQTNKFTANVGGDIGDLRTGVQARLFVQLVQGKTFDGDVFNPTRLTANADGNIKMILQGLLRDDTVGNFRVNLDEVDAGGAVTLQLSEGLLQTALVCARL